MPVLPESKDAPRTIDTDRVLAVYVHPDASMTVPKADWIWQLNWQDEPERAENMASDRMMAASIAESYRYLIMECNKDEAWHRIQQMRRAVRKYDRSED